MQQIEVIISEEKTELGAVKFYLDEDSSAVIQELVNQLRSGQPCFVINDYKEAAHGEVKLWSNIWLNKCQKLKVKLKILTRIPQPKKQSL